MDVHSDVSLRQMCNEPCFVSVTFGISMEGHLTGSGASLLTICSMVDVTPSQAWSESLADNKESLLLHQQTELK